jgi:2-dehydropantoate 2-reductase
VVDNRTALPSRFVHFDDWQPSEDSLIVLCTKCYDNAAVLRRLPFSADLIPVQNGFDPALTKSPGFEGIASFISECLPGRTHTRITRRGKLQFGYRNASTADEKLSFSRCVPKPELGNEVRAADLPRPIRALIECRKPIDGSFRVEAVPDILPYKYTKLMYNAAISPIAAAAGLDNGSLLWIPKARRLFFDLLLENYTILREAGIPLGKVGPLHPDTVHGILRHRFVADALAWAFYPTLRKTYCSMSGDLPRGRTEIDYYNRHLVDIAASRPCPINRRMVEVIHDMQACRAQPSVEMLDALARDMNDPESSLAHSV